MYCSELMRPYSYKTESRWILLKNVKYFHSYAIFCILKRAQSMWLYSCECESYSTRLNTFLSVLNMVILSNSPHNSPFMLHWTHLCINLRFNYRTFDVNKLIMSTTTLQILDNTLSCTNKPWLDCQLFFMSHCALIFYFLIRTLRCSCVE